MNKRFRILISVLLITLIAVSPAYAGGVSIKIGLGSITADGTAWGFGKDAVITLYAEGEPLVACFAPGNSNPAPGQNPPRVTASASQSALDNWLGKGKFEVNLEAEPDVEGLSPSQLGCPNDNWGAAVVFVFWDKVTITVVNAKDSTRYEQTYDCTTTHNPDTITCSPAP